MMSMSASGWRSMACVRADFRGVEPPVFQLAGAVLLMAPWLTSRANRGTSKSLAAGRAIAWRGRVFVAPGFGSSAAAGAKRSAWDVSSSNAPFGRPVSAEWAKELHALDSLSIHCAASWRMLRVGIGAASSWRGDAPGTAGSCGTPPRGLDRPPVSLNMSTSFITALCVDNGPVGGLASFLDFCCTASQFLPSANVSGCSSPRKRLATWWPCSKAAAALSYC
mmetsp:Transcript_118278/g.331280  ORF Transcript_118278/g.331280 Transcript_118278/m.331280 type:complete len:222 (+) Transcript_118278:1842-2507(+)